MHTYMLSISIWDLDPLVYRRSISLLILYHQEKHREVAWMKVIWTTVLESDRILWGPCRATASHLTRGLQAANHIRCRPHSPWAVARF